MARALKSIAIGSLILLSAIGCFVLAIKIVDLPYINKFALYYAHGPIENVFLVLTTTVIGVFIAIFKIADNKKITIPGLIVFFITIVVFGLFGIPGLAAMAIGGKVLALALSGYVKKGI